MKKRKIGVAPNKLALALNVQETARRFSLENSTDTDWHGVITNPRAYRIPKKDYEAEKYDKKS